MVKHKIPKEIEESISELQNMQRTDKKKSAIPDWAIVGRQGLYTTAPQLGDYILKHYKFKYFQRGTQEELYQYNPKIGLWRPVTKRQIEKIVTQKLRSIGDWSSKKMRDTTTYLLSLVNVEDASYTINDVIDVDKVHFKNGVYSFKDDKLLPHSPNYYFSRGRNYVLKTQNRPTPHTDKWLLESFGEDGYKLIKQYIGYLFYRTNETWQTFVILLAEGGDGKSTFFNWLNDVIGSENTSSVELEKLAIDNNRFSLSSLVGMSLNYDADITNALIKKPEKIKKITGNDYVDVEEKGKNAYKAKLFVKLMFAGNDLPSFTDTTAGFKRRAIIIPFHKISDFRERYSLKKIYQEIPSFTYKCLKAFWEVHDKKELGIPSNMKKLVDNWSGANNHVIEFLEDYCIVEEGAREKKVYVYGAYKNFCNDNGYKPLSSVQFTKELERLDTEPRIIDKQAKINGKNAKCYINIKLVKTEQMIPE
ncbi:DNA primase family protein [Limosilactobacillus reuteri]|uniref:DNA primase family protein n=1 Tax=Limosilactobacillus reuteri TaxID=1598 RepID=UPI00128C6FE2|nr:DNA primase family protein [Limosilactobacillus reuteri]MQB77349.1 DNA primase [Limosilactobacillus reuteri]MQB99387.1 DNA primase [Limosilactobacillus reuteri]